MQSYLQKLAVSKKKRERDRYVGINRWLRSSKVVQKLADPPHQTAPMMLMIMLVLSRLLLRSFKFFAAVVVVVVFMVVAAVVMVMRPLQFHVFLLPEREPRPTVADIDPPSGDLARSASKRWIEPHVVAGRHEHIVAVRNGLALAMFALASVKARGQGAVGVAAAVPVTERQREGAPGEVVVDGAEADDGQRDGFAVLELGRLFVG